MQLSFRIAFCLFVFYLMQVQLLAQELDPAKIRSGIDSLRKSDTAAIKVERQQVANEVKTTTVGNPGSKVFGAELFTTASLSFEPNLRIATPPNYILGSDDEILVNVYGVQEANIKLQVLPEGQVQIPQVGAVQVAGLTVDAASKRIKSKMAATAYGSLNSGNSKFGLTLTKIKSIRVTVLGANKPGQYTVSSLATLFNLLYLCGGPDSQIGSYRNIELLRDNKLIAKIDLYDFLLKGNASGNIMLKEGDVVRIPVYEKRVSISGEVKRPAVYEMKAGETMAQLIQFAGGFTEEAYTATVFLKQIVDAKRAVKDLAASDFSSYQLQKGDEITVGKVADRIENAIVLNGSVYRPGTYEFKNGLTLSALLKKADGLTPDAYTAKATISRLVQEGAPRVLTTFIPEEILGGKTDIAIMPQDQITIYSKTSFIDNYSVSIGGEIRKPGVFPYQENMSLKDLIFLAGGFTEAATTSRIELARRIPKNNDEKEKDTIAIILNIATDGKLTTDQDRLVLMPGDQITVRRQPGYGVQISVSIQGEVLFPGSYTVESKSERISKLLQRSGGFTKTAYKEGLYLIRKEKLTEDAVQQRVKLANNVQESLKDSLTDLYETVANPISRIAIDIEKVLNNPGSKEDLLLEEGDVLQVPRFESLVKVSGQVYAPSKMNFVEKENIRYYISAAGGKNQLANIKNAYVIYPNGKVRRSHYYIFGLIRSYPSIQPGAEIVVPRRADRSSTTFGSVIATTSSLLSVTLLTLVTLRTLQ